MAIRHPSFQIPIPARRPATVDAPAHVPRPDPQAQRFDRAMLLIEQGHWSQAFDEMSGLASGGHAAAARIALMLARRGAWLFGGRFTASRQEQLRWQHIDEQSAGSS